MMDKFWQCTRIVCVNCQVRRCKCNWMVGFNSETLASTLLQFVILGLIKPVAVAVAVAGYEQRIPSHKFLLLFPIIHLLLSTCSMPKVPP